MMGDIPEINWRDVIEKATGFLINLAGNDLDLANEILAQWINRMDSADNGAEIIAFSSRVLDVRFGMCALEWRCMLSSFSSQIKYLFRFQNHSRNPASSG